MKKSIPYISLLATLVLTSFSSSYAGEATIPNTFQSGATAVASEVNENFTAIKSAVDDNNDQIAELRALVTTLQSRIEELEGSNVMALEDYVSVEEDDRGALVQFSGVNLQINNGLGITDSINGLGNLIVGYDEETEYTTDNYCSDGSYDNQTDCENNGEIWDSSFKTGSHYLVLGSQNNYSRYGGLVAGYQSYARGNFSTINGGWRNDAGGEYSSVNGGSGNDASGNASTVIGGFANAASGTYSSISGGYFNTASSAGSSVSGGYGNTASGSYSSILGGSGNTVSTEYGTSP